MFQDGVDQYFVNNLCCIINYLSNKMYIKKFNLQLKNKNYFYLI